MSHDVHPARTWTDVAPLLARWQMALVPHHDGSWSVLSGYIRQPTVPQITVHSLPFAALPAAIADVAARCEAAEKGEERLAAGDRAAQDRYIQIAGESREYAASLENPRLLNWVRRDWIWL